MRLASFAGALAGMLALAGAPAFAADKAAQQAEIRKATQSALEKFYKAQPSLKAEVDAAPGYAVFTTYGLTFIVGGTGGGGLAHDKRTGHDTFMKMAQASAGLQAGVAQNDLLIVFKSQKALDNFVNKGWEFGGTGAVSAGVANKSAGGGAGQQEISEAKTYSLTKNGLEIGAALAGTKFWKEKGMN
jgi:lipid-binding SYLF domain-containing protein